MDLSTRHARRWAAALIGLLALAASNLWQFAQIRAWNALMTSDNVTTAPDNSPGEVRFAKAHALAERGEVLAALAMYRELAGEGDTSRRAAATFNEGNLLLREGLALRARGDEFRALPLLELAKESYRQLLSEQPGDWDARYNLELALRAAPEPEEEESVSSPPPVRVRRSDIVLRREMMGLP